MAARKINKLYLSQPPIYTNIASTIYNQKLNKINHLLYNNMQKCLQLYYMSYSAPLSAEKKRRKKL